MLDATRKTFDFEQRDVLFHSRWVFHRSTPLSGAGREHVHSLGSVPQFKSYSIRHEHGDSKLLNGLNSEFAVLLNRHNKGKTLSEVNRNDGPFYPQCWPNATAAEEIENIDKLVEDQFPAAERLLKEFFAEIMAKAAAIS